jgi:hypothetical protein
MVAARAHGPMVTHAARTTTRAAVEAACAYLLARQQADGRFVDYVLPVGPSDEWVTAVAGLALADAGARGWHSGAAEAAHRAAGWLARGRRPRAGWGFNRRTEADADSTAHVLQLFARLALPVADADVAWLMSHRHYGAGFATYRRDDGWGEPHPDVTPVAFFALPFEERLAYGEELADWVLANRAVDGCWPAYWWRSGHYSTYWNLRMLRALGRATAAPPGMIVDPLRGVRSCFELGWVAGILAVAGDATEARAVVAALLERQASDGSWPGCADLRVTDSRYRRPWSDPPLSDDRSRCYVDVAGILTTASIVRVLSV